MRCQSLICGLLMLIFGMRSLHASGLSIEIDRCIARKEGVAPLAGPCDDAAFVRRVYLDLAGRIPRLTELKSFLDESTSADKRTQLIDRLLASPEYPRHMEEVFHILLMERRGDHLEWSKFLRTSFEANKPWDQLTREIIQPDSKDETKRGAAFFQTRRLEKSGQQATDHPGLTRDIGRLFMGVDLQCAQCHDHLFIKDYKQRDFQGLYVVFSNTSVRTDVAFPAIAEKPSTGKLEFVSVFEGMKQATGPRIPFQPESDLPLPAGSALAVIANSIATADNPLFVRNAVNRFWFLVMGRGLVHPLDLNHSTNLPSHPELLDLLQREFTAHRFDIKWLIRELMLTETYARSSDRQDGTPPAPETFSLAIERRLSAEQLLRSMLLATGDPAVMLDEASLASVFTALRPKAIKAFANPAKEPEDSYQATVEGALFLLNDPELLKLFEPKGQNLIGRVVLLDDPAQVIEELYQTILTRRPDDRELTELTASISSDLKQRDVAQWVKQIRQLAWALIASSEFSMNH